MLVILTRWKQDVIQNKIQRQVNKAMVDGQLTNTTTKQKQT